MLDVLAPTLTYCAASRPFLTIRADGLGNVEIKSGVKVPNYENAISYYLNDHPENVANEHFIKEGYSTKVKVAYKYLWKIFQVEIEKRAPDEELKHLFLAFRELEVAMKQYESLRKWIIEEREQILKQPTEGGIVFVQFMDDAYEIVSLLVCLDCVCTIIKEGIQILRTRLNIQSIETAQNNRSIGFETYIKEEHRVKLMPYLIKHYTNKKPGDIAQMLYALEKIGAMTGKITKFNQTDLHHGLVFTFGSIGARNSLSTALQRYDSKEANNDQKRQIEICSLQIESFLKS